MSFRTRIILLFILMLFGTVGALGAFVFSGWLGEVRHAVNQTAAWTAGDVAHRLDRFVDAPLHLVEVHQELLRNGVVDLSAEAERDRFFSSVLHSHEGSSIMSFTIGLSSGEYYGARWNASGELELVNNNDATGGNSWYYAVEPDGTAGERVLDAGSFDPRTRVWYQMAMQAQTNTFSPVYAHFLTRDLALSVGRPVSGPAHEWSGVLAAHVTLGQISRELTTASLEPQAQTVVVERETGFLVANSLGEMNYQLDASGQMQRRELSPDLHEAFFRCWQTYRTQGTPSLRIRLPTGRATALVTEYRRNGIDWVILTAVPETVFTREPYAYFWISGLIALLLLGLASFLFIRLANRYLRPVKTLIQASKAFSSGNLKSRTPVSRHDEIGEMAVAFNGMADTIEAQVEHLEEMVLARTVELEAANRTLETSEDRLRLILDSTAEAIYGLDAEGRCTFCNASCLRVLGYPAPEALLGRNMHEAIHHSHQDGSPFPESACPIYDAIRNGQGIHVAEDLFWRADGTSVEVSYHAYPQYRKGKLRGAVVSFMDITESKQVQARIHHLGTHDALTGLYNRPAFDEALRMAEREEWVPVSILFGDVNGLKLTNDIFGHEAGDRLLRTSADILMRICREEDTVARVGGDEFTVLLPFTGATGALQLRDRILKAFSETSVSGMRCSISIGLATRTDGDTRLEEVLKKAEEEMYTAKALERKRNDDTFIGNLMDTLFGRAPREKDHAGRMERISARIGQTMKLPDSTLRRLREASRLHDIGKVVLDEAALAESEILDIPPGGQPVSDSLMRHVLVGYRILNLSSDTVDLAESILAHHEHWDGSGYPKGIRGEEIPMISRILLVSEHVEAHTGRAEHDTIGDMSLAAYLRRGSGSLFDPAVVDAFLETPGTSPHMEPGAVP